MKLNDLLVLEDKEFYYAGDCRHGFMAHVDCDATQMAHLVDSPETVDVPEKEFLSKVPVSPKDIKNINQEPAQYEFLWNKEHNVLILYDTKTDIHKFFLPVKDKT